MFPDNNTELTLVRIGNFEVSIISIPTINSCPVHSDLLSAHAPAFQNLSLVYFLMFISGLMSIAS